MSGSWHGGKGSRPRPLSVEQSKFDENMDRIFGSKEEERLAKAREKEEYFAKLAAETKARLEQAEQKKNETQAINELSKLIAEETLQSTEPVAEDNK